MKKKKTKPPKFIYLKTKNDTWKLSRFGMETVPPPGNAIHFVARGEVLRGFSMGGVVFFRGALYWPDSTSGHPFEPVNDIYTFQVLPGGEVLFGCKVFDKTSAKKLRRWAYGGLVV